MKNVRLFAILKQKVKKVTFFRNPPADGQEPALPSQKVTLLLSFYAHVYPQSYPLSGLPLGNPSPNTNPGNQELTNSETGVFYRTRFPCAVKGRPWATLIRSFRFILPDAALRAIFAQPALFFPQSVFPQPGLSRKSDGIWSALDPL